jgi:hypothetical protein
MNASAAKSNRLLAEAAAIRAPSPLGWINTDVVSVELEVIELESFLACEAVALA